MFRKNVVFALREANSGTFYMHWRVGRRTKRKSTGTKNIENAKAFLANWLKVDLTGAPTCGVLWELYHRDHVIPNCKDHERHFYAWKKLERRFATLRPAEVTRDVIARHLAARLPTSRRASSSSCAC